jgi:hypothetical protein
MFNKGLYFGPLPLTYHSMRKRGYGPRCHSDYIFPGAYFFLTLYQVSCTFEYPAQLPLPFGSSAQVSSKGSNYQGRTYQNNIKS